ncbi:hypothetical protein ACFX12_045463 [Malus domestica]
MFAKGSGDLGEAYMFAQMGFPREAIDLYVDMLLSGLMPDQFALSGVILACTKLESLSLGQQLHSWVIQSGLALGHCVGCCLVDMYSKCAADGSMNDAWKVFDRMLNNNVVSWTAIINGYVQSGKGDEEAIKLFVEMMSGLVLPNHFTFSSILKTSANLLDLRTGEQVHSLEVKSGQVEDAHKSSDVLYEKNLISYNTVVDAYAKHSDAEEAFGLFHEIQDTGFGAGAFTFSSL